MSTDSQTPPVTTVQFSDHVQSTRSRATRRTPLRERRYTPYTKTPMTRNLRSTKNHTRAIPRTGAKSRTPPSANNNAEDIQNNLNKELLNKTWRVCRVSPMFKLSCNPQDLRHYSRVLSAHLEAESVKNQAVKVEAENANLAQFTVLPGLKKSAVDSEAIKIDLKQKPKRTNGDPVVVMTAILLCVDGPENILQKIPKSFSLRPVMLVKGPVALGRCLSQWLQSQFDCLIHPMIFPPNILAWMVAMWAGSVPDKKSRSVELQYTVPAEMEGLSTITLTIDGHDCKRLWECIHTNEDDSFREDEVNTFLKSIEAHFRHHFQININAMPLAKVGTSVAYIGAEGKLKIFGADHIHQVLSHITEFVMERTLSLHYGV